MTTHCFTVDVEEYFHVSAFESVISREDWPRWQPRLDVVMPTLLATLEAYEVRATFFVLGWVADRMPHLVRSIADAGHEIASHGYWHRRITSLQPSDFREDVRTSKSLLEDIIGAPVTGFRAPSFSIAPGFEWAFDILLEEGFRYDSSLFPIRRPGYGYPSAPRNPHIIRRPSGSLAEFPLATATAGPITLPAAGGGYLRQLPFPLIRRAFRQASRDGFPATFYIHPWEIDPAQPRVSVSLATRVRHYRGLSTMLSRMKLLLDEFSFAPIATFVERLIEPAHQIGSVVS